MKISQTNTVSGNTSNYPHQGCSGSAVIVAETDHELTLHFQAGVLASITASEEKEAET